MNILIKTRDELKKAKRWDIDYHMPAKGIKLFPSSIIKKVSDVADISKDKERSYKTT
ncbi:hypothetical protein [Photorhabdus australis]|uniref:hypothetical protein n=1 Tax=Photorhabdus australis TaxID=286156 RepID=UPI000ABBC567|nr:hypothetical protein [Photorhabdus australis]